MEKQNAHLHDKNNGLDYVLVGDYYFPALILAEDFRSVDHWGRMYKRYLKEHHPARYQVLLLSGRLNTYLADIDQSPVGRPLQHPSLHDQRSRAKILW